ncbi:hypothetical protein ASPFODRAFT_45576 [Aspergillus luchuensis CBS 106.47]|uniref:Uncharacterized protein n=1 Tax=Aspergillus luchuensis (strain CBS 106.47) TaxID=1137211 RepID=A0A1M3TMH4_ASPLC|nr:hypothetical protein ASPFODRAFT_45576 [Aspergillus luchuensis CBS 106.47]
MGPAAASLPRSSIGILLLKQLTCTRPDADVGSTSGLSNLSGRKKEEQCPWHTAVPPDSSLIPDSLSLLLSLSVIINRRGGSRRIHGMDPDITAINSQKPKMSVQLTTNKHPE